VALGVFDGVHAGHREILGRTVGAADRQGIDPIVFSFRNHPRSVLRGEDESVPRLLVTPERRIELIKQQGIREVVCPEFTWGWAKTPARSFVEEFLVGALRARHVVAGFNYCFGNKAEGRTKDLIDYGQRYGFGVEIVSACEVDGGEVSSTRIREAIIAGDLDLARHLLGRPHEFSGTVIEGDGRGRELGFRTANLQPDLAPLLPLGVYAVRAQIQGRDNKLSGMFFLGPRKTFGENDARSAEVHLFDFEEDLYGRHIRLEVHRKIREGRKFETREDLIRQLEKDREACQEVLRGAS
jgi:riboflavin kinase/FMN adenylyltransferase